MKAGLGQKPQKRLPTVTTNSKKFLDEMLDNKQVVKSITYSNATEKRTGIRGKIIYKNGSYRYIKS